jgi:hypothetical protein
VLGGILIDIGDLFFFKKKVPQNGKQINNAAVIVVIENFTGKREHGVLEILEGL